MIKRMLLSSTSTMAIVATLPPFVYEEGFWEAFKVSRTAGMF